MDERMNGRNGRQPKSYIAPAIFQSGAINIWKMMCNNPKLNLVNINAYIKFGEILPIDSQYIERKRNFGLNQGL